MLKKLSTSLLLHEELAETIKKFEEVIRQLGISHEFLLLVLNLLSTDVTRIREAIAAQRHNKKVGSVAEADAQREDSFVGFKEHVESARRRRDPAVKEAYEAIWPIFEAVGTQIYRLGYVEQSGKLEALFEKLDQPENQAYLITMRAEDYYAELREAHQEFLVLSGEKRSEDELLQYPTLDAAKSAAVPHVNAFLSIVSVLWEVSPAEEKELYKSLIDKLNIIITDIMTVARARKTRKENRNGDESDNDNGENGDNGDGNGDNSGDGDGNNTDDQGPGNPLGPLS